MNKIKNLTGRTSLACQGMLLAALLTGCVGVVGPGYYGGGPRVDVYAPVPDVVVFGGFGGGGHDRDFGRRGGESRASFGGRR